MKLSEGAAAVVRLEQAAALLREADSALSNAVMAAAIDADPMAAGLLVGRMAVLARQLTERTTSAAQHAANCTQ